MALSHIKIDNREDFEARIYVHAHRYNPFLSGWGAVIDQQDEKTELHGSSDEDANRLLLVATIAALESLSDGVPVTVLCPSNYLTRWVIERLSDLRDDDWKLARQKANFDLVKRLHLLTWRRPYALAETVRSGRCSEKLNRADELARSCGSVDCYAKSGSLYGRSKVKKPEVKRVAGVSLATVNPLDDVPWD